MKSAITKSSLKTFADSYDIAHEDAAAASRGAFVRAFPISTLPDLKLRSYCIGHKSPSFCTFAEVTTRPWANILGATALKFGIYYGRSKDDSQKKYRFAEKFGTTQGVAFSQVKTALVELVALGRKSHPDFKAIDANPLSQMFKAKVLSLYFPERFLNVCSGDHLQHLASTFGWEAGKEVSRYQHLLLKEKLAHEATRHWSNPKFMAFLYADFLGLPRANATRVTAPKKRRFPEVDFDALLAARKEIGERAEVFAWNWEVERLVGLGVADPESQLEDLRSRPGFGYDFASQQRAGARRCIEVKAIATKGDDFRFFMSENERRVSLSPENEDHYYFYFVKFNGDREAVECTAMPSVEVHKFALLRPASYEVRLRWND